MYVYYNITKHSIRGVHRPRRRVLQGPGGPRAGLQGILHYFLLYHMIVCDILLLVLLLILYILLLLLYLISYYILCYHTI